MGQKIVVDLALEGEKLSWRWPGGRVLFPASDLDMLSLFILFH
jgi:hypothetical protein